MPLSRLLLRFPAPGDSPNIAQYFQNLANDVDALLGVPRFQTYTRPIGSGEDQYTGSASLISGTWTGAPAGDYLLHYTINCQFTANIAGTIAVTAGGQTLTAANEKADVSTSTAAKLHDCYPFTYAGGNLAVNVVHSVGANNVKVYNAGTKIVLEYLGRRS